LTRLVFALLDATGAGPESLPARPWLAALALPDEDGTPTRADELMLPDALIRPLLTGGTGAPGDEGGDDAPIGTLADAVAEEYPRRLLTAVGVLDSFALVHDEQPSGPDHDLADEELWWDEVGGHGEPGPLTAIRDLDLVADDAWPAALALLAADPRFRPALRAQPGQPEPYTRWWLDRNARLDGRLPGYWRLPGATELAGFYDPVPAEVAERVDTELLTAIGVRAEVRVADRDDAADLLDRLGDPARQPDVALIWRVHDQLADSVLDGRVNPADFDPPQWLRALDGSVVDAGDAVLLDGTWLATALPPAETVAGRLDRSGVGALAELFDLPLASEVVVGRVVEPSEGGSSGEWVEWAGLPEVVTGCAVTGFPVPVGGLIRYPTLTVALTRPTTARVRVPVWWQDGQWHAEDPMRALLAMWSRYEG
jgi:hypothetical protein